MLNIGRLGTNIDATVTYYLSNSTRHLTRSTPDLQSAVESYYLGDKEHDGRWVGSLRDQLGVCGAVEEKVFRRLLEGCHPLTGVPLTDGAKKAQARRMRAHRRPALPKNGDAVVNVATAARYLELSSQHIRRLLDRGKIARTLLDKEPAWSYLSGTKVQSDSKTGPGRGKWQIPVSELRRFHAAHERASMRPGFDLTLRPTKSVSILWALGGPDVASVVARAHREAVDEVISYYEDRAIFSRKRVGDKQLRIATEGLIGAAFDHRTSRAGDPLLHTHVVVFNVTRCADGEWRALDGTPVYEHAKTGGYLYQAHVRHVLTREFGLSWTEVVNGCAEIDGIPPELIDTFSKRRDEIETAVAEAGYSSPAAHQAATLATRQPKGNQTEPPVAIEQWWQEAEALGFTKADLEALLSRAAHVEMEAPEPQTPLKYSLDDFFGELMSEEGLTQMMSNFAERDALRTLAERAGAELTANELRAMAEEFLETAGPVRLEVVGDDTDMVLGGEDETVPAPGFTRFSTPELMSKEAHILDWAHKSLHVPGARCHAEATARALDRHRELTGEQVTMVRSLTNGRRRLHLVVGDPGSGKTYAAGVAVEAWVESGVSVIGATVSSDAGEELALSTGLATKTGRDASTISMLLIELDDPEFGGFAPNTVLILDEASMVSTRMLYRLIEHLDAASGTLVMLGDPNQHGSIEAGGVYRRLTRKHKAQVIGLRENNRQVDEVERSAIAEFRELEIRKALARYDDGGKIVRSKTLSESYDAMAADWYVQWSMGDRSPMLAGLNTMRRALNDRARMLLKAEGVLGPAVTVAEREFAVGDWVVAKHNDRRLRGPKRAWIKNGSLGTVKTVNGEDNAVTVEFEREGLICVPTHYLTDGNLEHAYARTTYGVQGKTHETTVYQPSDLSGHEEGYVAITRARSGTRIYLVEDETADINKPACSDYGSEWKLDTNLIVKALEKKRAKLMAHDLEQPVSEHDDDVDLPRM